MRPERDPARPAFVDAVEALVRQRISATVATVTVDWSPRAGSWWIEVEPSRPGAARVSVMVLDDELLVVLPNSRYEIWRSRDVDPLEVLEADLDDIVAGRVEELGRGSDRRVRLRAASGAVRTRGALAVVLRRQHVTTYEPFVVAPKSVS